MAKEVLTPKRILEMSEEEHNEYFKNNYLKEILEADKQKEIAELKEILNKMEKEIENIVVKVNPEYNKMWKEHLAKPISKRYNELKKSKRMEF